jgi:phage recombination protein Bet
MSKPTEETTTGQSVVPAAGFLREELNSISVIKKEYTEEQWKFVKSIVNKDLTDTELLVFVSFASKLQLNPLLREIIAVVYNKNDPAKRQVNYIVPRDGKRIVANRSGGLESVTKEAIYVKEGQKVEPWAGGTLWGAEATARRNGVDFRVVVPLSEYDTHDNVWKYKPETMIKKVAESQALTAAFPELLGGVYDDSEQTSIDAAEPKELTVPNAEDPATEKQLEALVEQGYTPAELEGTTRAQAVKLLTSKRKATTND